MLMADTRLDGPVEMMDGMLGQTGLAWQDTWSIGVPEMDRQHGELLADFVRLLDPARRRDHVFQRQALEALTEHVCHHFDDEEHLMRVYGYPERQAHAEVHAMLLKQLNHFETLLQAQPEDGPGPTILDFVGRWLIDHIRQDDRRLGEFLREVGAVPDGP